MSHSGASIVSFIEKVFYAFETITSLHFKKDIYLDINFQVIINYYMLFQTKVPNTRFNFKKIKQGLIKYEI
jgi:hypothetical protein